MSNLNESPQASVPKKTTGQPRASKIPDAGSHKPRTDKKPDAGSHKPPKQSTPVVASEKGTRTAQTEQYSFGEVLGTGSFGEVYHCKDSDEKSYAIKTMKPAPKDDKRAKESQAREKKILFYLLEKIEFHESIVKFFGSFERSFEEEDTPRICFIFEHLGGPCLIEKVEFEPIEDVGMIKTISKQIVGGLQYLHENGIIHGDLKPENIQFKYADPSKHTIKIVDFGLSRRETKRPVKHLNGTILYQPPEICGSQKKVTRKLDIWAFGVVLWEMFHGLERFPIRPITYTIALKIKKDRELAKGYMAEVNDKEFAKVLEFNTEAWKKNPEAVRLAKGVLEKDHNSRFTAADALAIPWLKD